MCCSNVTATMPEGLIYVLVPLFAAGLVWVLKRVVGSVIDERVTPQIAALRSELRAHMDDETNTNDTFRDEVRILHSSIGGVSERVARLEGSQR